MLFDYKTWSEESLMQVYDDDDDLHGGQRSSEVKCDTLCAMIPYLVEKNADASSRWRRLSWRSKG